MNKPKAFLFLTELPFPARRNGISIRYVPIMQKLLKSYELHVAVAVNYAVSDEDRAEALRYAANFDVYSREKSKTSLARRVSTRLICCLPFTTPYPVLSYDNREIAEFLRQSAGQTTYDVVISATATFADLVRRNVSHKRFVVDAIDSAFVLLSRRQNGSWIEKFDNARVKRWERRVAKHADYFSYVSESDLQLVFGAQIDTRRIGVVANGIFRDDFEANTIKTDGLTIGFLGNMGYQPNISAVRILFSVFKRVRFRVPNAKLLIIGRSPSPEIEAFAAVDGVTVTGEVESIWKYVHATTVFAFPLVEGAGQQNKVLEAMAAGVPVVTTAIGCGGIGAVDNESIRLAETEADFARILEQLLSNAADRRRLGEAGKRFVENRFGWDPIVNQMQEKYLGTRTD